MANSLFTPAREGLLDTTINVVTGVIKVALVRSYTYNAAHKFVSEVTGAGGVIAATSGAIANKTETAGAFDGDDVTFAAVASNASAHSLLVYQSSAAAGGADVASSAQRVLLWLDTGTNLPISPNGGDVVVAFDSGANKIFHV